MKQPMRPRARRSPPKIMGNTARTPKVLSSLGSLALCTRPGATPPAGSPGVRNFPRLRLAAPPGECHRSPAVARFLARRVAVERATQQAAERAAQIEAKGRRGKTARGWQGRPGEEAKTLEHSPAAARPAAPALGDAGVRAHELPPTTTRRGAALRREQARLQPARPRPSRALAELGEGQAEATGR